MKVELFVSPTCSHRDQASAIVAEALADSERSEQAEIISIGEYELAKTRRFFGSPTVRIDGMDVEYGEREPEEFSTGCRFYNTPDGWQPLPRKELVVRGIQTALRRQQAAQKQS